MLSRVLGIVGRLLIIAGLVILGFAAFQLWGTGLEESRQQDALLEDFAGELGVDPGSGQGMEIGELAAEAGTAEGPPPTPVEGEPLAIIEIPRIELSRVVVEGTTRAELKKGPGHYVGTPFPGQPGNVGIAGHRTTYGAPFNRLDELAPGDEVILSTGQGRFTYRVVPGPDAEGQAWFAVSPTQTEVLADVGDNRVTLTACHPKYSARQRIIVQAVLEDPPAPPTPVAEPAAASGELAEDFDEGLGPTPEELPFAVGYGLAAALVGLGTLLIARRVRHGWALWLVATPAILVLVWNGYVHMDRYLPAI